MQIDDINRPFGQGEVAGVTLRFTDVFAYRKRDVGKSSCSSASLWLIKRVVEFKKDVSMIESVLLTIVVLALGQQSVPQTTSHSACGVVEEGYGRPQKPPVVYGKPYIVPKFRLQITDKQTGRPIAEREVIVRYVWRWFEYPYPERPLGVWSDTYDLVKCTTGYQGEVEMSEFRVVPSGWYKGGMLMGRDPEFTHLDVSVHLEKQITHVRLTKDDLEHYRRSKADVIPLQVSLVSPLPQ